MLTASQSERLIHMSAAKDALLDIRPDCWIERRPNHTNPAFVNATTAAWIIPARCNQCHSRELRGVIASVRQPTTIRRDGVAIGLQPQTAATLGRSTHLPGTHT